MNNSAIEQPAGPISELELKRELLRLRFAVSRLRVRTALTQLQGDAAQSTPARAMAWLRAPWLHRLLPVVAVGVLAAALWRFGWRRPARWVAEGLSLWQLAKPWLGKLRIGPEADNDVSYQTQANAPAGTTVAPAGGMPPDETEAKRHGPDAHDGAPSRPAAAPPAQAA